MIKTLLLSIVFALVNAAAFAQGQVTIACGTSPATAAPCGTSSNPVATTGTGGTAPAPVSVAATDRGGTLTAGGTSQQLAASNTSRKSIIIENPCTAAGQGGIATAEDLYVAIVGAATVGGASNYADLAPCGSTAITVSGQVYTGAVNVNATTIGHRWSSTEFQ